MEVSRAAAAVQAKVIAAATPTPTPVAVAVPTATTTTHQPTTSLFTTLAAWGRAFLKKGYAAPAVTPAAAPAPAPAPAPALAAVVGTRKRTGAKEPQVPSKRQKRNPWSRQEVHFVQQWIRDGHEGDWIGCLNTGQAEGVFHSTRTQVSVKDCARTLKNGGYKSYFK